MGRIAVVAGETSGDIHAGNLVAELLKARPELEVWAVGGERLSRAGAQVIFHSSRIAAMGLVEAASKLPALAEARRTVIEKFKSDPPDIFIPVDFGGFNLRLAAEAHKLQIPVIYFIPPKAWAWGKGRVKKIKRLIDKLLVILPFEETFWRGHGMDVAYVGSPVLDHLQERRFEAQEGVVGLLPGSRAGEISRIWPLMTEAARLMAQERELKFLVARAEGLDEGMPDMGLMEGLDAEVITADSQEVMERSTMSIVASGTATLECALLNTPMVAVYQLSPLTYLAAKLLVKLEHVTLPNLVAGREVVPELIQEKPGNIARVAVKLLDETPERRKMLDGLAQIQAAMGERGASASAATIILEELDKRSGLRSPGSKQ